jgi:hypothetical protein
MGSDPAVEFSVDQVNLFEVRRPRYSPPDPFSNIHSQKKPTRKRSNRWKAFSNAACLQVRGVWFLFLPPEILSREYQTQTSLSNVVSLFSPIAAGGAELVGVVTQYHKLRFKYRLFERKPESFEFVGRASVEASPKQTMQVVWDAVRRSIESLPNHGTNTGHRIQVYEVWGLDFPFNVWLMHHSLRKRSRKCTTSRPRKCIT